jgi:hypothetical protein
VLLGVCTSFAEIEGPIVRVRQRFGSRELRMGGGMRMKGGSIFPVGGEKRFSFNGLEIEALAETGSVTLMFGEIVAAKLMDRGWGEN